MVRVVYKHQVAPGTETAFVTAWERCRSRMLARAEGALEVTLLRNANRPTEYSSVTTWRSVEDWKQYWSVGVADPEGEPSKNEVLVEVASISSSR